VCSSAAAELEQLVGVELELLLRAAREGAGSISGSSSAVTGDIVARQSDFVTTPAACRAASRHDQ
jgi:hypothetical protein